MLNFVTVIHIMYNCKIDVLNKHNSIYTIKNKTLRFIINMFFFHWTVKCIYYVTRKNLNRTFLVLSSSVTHNFEPVSHNVNAKSELKRERRIGRDGKESSRGKNKRTSRK